MKQLLLVGAFIGVAAWPANAQSNDRSTAASKAPSQQQAAEMMKILSEALGKNGYPGYKITAVAARDAAPATAGAAATGTVPPTCYIWESPFGTFTYCN